MSKEVSFKLLYCLGANFKVLSQLCSEYSEDAEYMSNLDSKRDLALIRSLCRIRYNIIKFPNRYASDFSSSVREYLARDYEIVTKYKIDLAMIWSRESLEKVVNTISSYINSLSQEMLKILEIPNYESMDILFKFPILDLDDFNELSEKVSNTFMPYGILIPCLLNTECVNKKTMFDNDEELYKAVSVIIGSSLKNTPYNIDRPQGRTNVYVDCENTNIITFMKLLKFLDPMIKDCNIKLFIDSYKSKLWQHIDTILNTPVKLEKVYINRLSPSKSILDVAMASAVVADVYSNTELDNVIIVSSDSDFYNMLLSIQDKVNTYVVYSHRAVSTSYMMSLCSAGKIQTIEDNVLASEKDTQELYKKGIDYSVISYASQCIVKHFDRADLLKELRNTLGKEVVISDESVQDALDHLVINYQGDSLVLTINDLTITARKDD